MPRSWTTASAGVVLSLFLASPPIPASSQSTDSVTGLVLDGSTGEPVSGALVEVQRLDGSPLGVVATRTLAGADGRFVLGGIPEGAFLVRVEHLGYGAHTHPLRLEGDGTAAVEILLTPSAIELTPIIAGADASRRLAELGSPSSRNIRTRDEIAPAAASGVTLGDYLRREIGGISVRAPAGGDVGGYLCVEFRGARRAEQECNPPQVRLDGTVVPNPLNFFGDFSLDGLERIQVIPPAEAGAQFGTNGGWGVVLLETRRAGLLGNDGIPVARRTSRAFENFDWNQEARPHPWAKVYTAAFLGNAAGLAVAGTLLSRCMDLDTRSFYRGQEYCGHGALLGTSILAAVLPPLTAGFAGRWHGPVDRPARTVAVVLPPCIRAGLCPCNRERRRLEPHTPRDRRDRADRVWRADTQHDLGPTLPAPSLSGRRYHDERSDFVLRSLRRGRRAGAGAGPHRQRHPSRRLLPGRERGAFSGRGAPRIRQRGRNEAGWLGVNQSGVQAL